jgi:hypothetical protein
MGFLDLGGNGKSSMDFVYLGFVTLQQSLAQLANYLIWMIK